MRSASHKNDDLLSNKQRMFRDYAARFRPGYCLFLGPGPDKTWTNEKCEAARPEVNWDTKILADSSEIQRTLTQSFLAPLVLIRKPSNTKKGRESIHFNVSLATVSMICKLTESVNHVLLAVMNYMSDLPEKTNSHRRAALQWEKRTPRVQESCAVPEATDPNEKKKHVQPTTARTAARGGSSSSSVKETSNTG